MKIRTLFLFSLYIALVICLVPYLLFCMLFGIREPLYAIGKWAMRLSRRILGIELEVKGMEAVDRKTPYVFMANHISFIDGPLLFTVIPQNVRVIIKKAIFRVPVLGIGMKHVGFVPVDRQGTSGGRELRVPAPWAAVRGPRLRAADRRSARSGYPLPRRGS